MTTTTPSRPVIVYGASGYTGRLICEYLREFGVPFIAAGRDEGRLKASMEAHVSGIETADYEIVQVEHTDLDREVAAPDPPEREAEDRQEHDRYDGEEGDAESVTEKHGPEDAHEHERLHDATLIGGLGQAS